MQSRNLLLALGAAAMAVALELVPAQAQAPMALSGQVSSAAEGPMEGVIISAKREGSTTTISVVSDSSGKFSFPASRLAPGRYSLAIRAVGYDLEAPKSADVAADGTTTAEIKLRPTKNLAKQLTNAEWLASFPGTDTQKKALLNCISCHNLDRIVSSNHDAAEFVQVFDRMTGYYPGSTPQHPQRLLGDARRNLGQAAGVKAMAEYLASVNLSRDEVWDYPLKTLPRPTGRATRVVMTEYDLPRKQIQPHDAIVDADGMVWFTHFGEQFLGKLDPKTGRVSEYPLPVLKPGYPVGTLDLETDKAGNLWIAMMYQGGVARFDKATEKFQTWKVPDQWQTDATQQAFLTPTYSDVDGKVWVKNSDRAQILRLDPATGQWEESRIVQGREQSHHHLLRHPSRPRQQSLSARFLLLEYRQARCQDRQAHRLPLADSELASAARPGRRAEPSVVRGICRQCHRHVRPQDREDPGMGAADAMGAALRRGHGQEWRSLDRLDAERSGVPARSQDRRVRGISVAEDHQYPPRVRRQLDQPGDVLGRQQSRRLDREGRTAGLRYRPVTLLADRPMFSR